MRQIRSDRSNADRTESEYWAGASMTVWSNAPRRDGNGRRVRGGGESPEGGAEFRPSRDDRFSVGLITDGEEILEWFRRLLPEVREGIAHLDVEVDQGHGCPVVPRQRCGEVGRQERLPRSPLRGEDGNHLAVLLRTIRRLRTPGGPETVGPGHSALQRLPKLVPTSGQVDHVANTGPHGRRQQAIHVGGAIAHQENGRGRRGQPDELGQPERIRLLDGG